MSEGLFISRVPGLPVLMSCVSGYPVLVLTSGFSCCVLLENYTLSYLAAQGTLGHLHLPDLTRVMKVYQGALYVYPVPLQVVEQDGVP